MSQIEVHFHLAYIGGDQFQFTLTNKSNPGEQMVEAMSFGDLQRSIRKLKPGSKTLRIGKQTIEANSGIPLDSLREYFKKVHDSYVRAIATGRDLDAELREIERNPDPTDGSGGLSMN